MKSCSADPARLRARRQGQWAERLAAWWLRLKLYRVLARQVDFGRGRGAGEIDLVVRRGDLVAFVEIKSRADLETAAHALTPAQRRRIERAAAAFLARRPDLASLAVRFDLVLVAPGRWPHHVKDAWRPQS
jgi:putative endonuclease